MHDSTYRVTVDVHVHGDQWRVAGFGDTPSKAEIKAWVEDRLNVHPALAMSVVVKTERTHDEQE